MRSLLLLLVPLLAGGAVYWFVSSGEAPPSGDGEQPLSAGAEPPAPEMKAKKTLRADTSGGRVAESVPEDIFDAEKSESAIYEKPELLDTRIEIPSGVETMTGDLILRSIARILGPDKPFHFESAAALAEFRRRTFDGVPSGDASLAELMAYCPEAGYGFFQRDKTLYMVRLPKAEED